MVSFSRLPGMVAFCIVVFTRTLASAVPIPQGDDDEKHDGGLAGLTAPAVEGVVEPLSTGFGRGVAGAAAGTQQTADILGDAMENLLHTLGGVAGNVEEGAGVAVANAGNAAQDTVYVQS